MRFIFVLLLAIVFTMPTLADEIPNGLWQGTMVPPEGHEVGVGFKVQTIAGRTLMTMSVPHVGVIPLKKPALEDGVMTFSFKMGETPINCRLEATAGGGYSGPCEDEAGASGSIEMNPLK